MRARARGLTLIELLASLAILATLLTGVLLSKQRAMRQWRSADRRLQALTVADALLTRWCMDGQLPAPAEGMVDGRPQWRWRTSLVDVPQAAALRARVAELQVFSVEDARQVEQLASVEVLVPLPARRRAENEEDGDAK